MASIISKIDNKSFSVDVPIRLIGSEYYTKKYVHGETISKALDEIGKYRKAFNNARQERDKQVSEMMAHIDCLEAELLEVQCHYDKSKQELAVKDRTKMSDTLMENSPGEARELLSRHLYENLCCVELNRKTRGLILPVEPVDVAAVLIKATETVKTNSIQRVLDPNMPDEYETGKHSKSDLRQTVEYLLAYYKNIESEDRLNGGMEMMSTKNIDWLSRCKQNLREYRIDVDDDCIFVMDLQAYDCVCTFSSYGYEFAQKLLCFFSYNAELV